MADTMIRKAFLMSLHPGQHDEYRRRHNLIWPELAQTLKAHGVHHYSIFLHENTHQLFGYVEIEREECWAAIAETDICRRWRASMQEIMPSNSDSSPISAELTPCFIWIKGLAFKCAASDNCQKEVY